MASYPKTTKLTDGTSIELREMAADDRDAVLAFARALTEDDLLFLRVDLTQPEVIDNWIANLERGDSYSLAAYDGTEFVGYATVHRTTARWTRRVGEIRVNVASSFRSRGLGRVLISEIFDVARGLDLKKLMANMVADQRGAQAAFQRLGFVVTALLTDFVEDAKGKSRDLIIMCHDIDGHSEQVNKPVRI